MLDIVPVPILPKASTEREINNFNKYPIILQQSEEDCGAACLASIAKYHGRNLTINRIRETIGTNQQGTTLLGLKQGADTIGFNARSVKANPGILNKIDQAPLPAIIHWQGYHWVVLYGKQGDKYVIADPAIGIRFLSEKELAEAWEDWVCLLVEPDAKRFFSEADEKVSSISRLLRRVWYYRQIIIQVFLLNIVLGLLSIASPFLVQILTDDVLVRGDFQLLTSVVIAVIVMNIFSSCLELVQSNMIAHFAQRLELGLVMEFGRQILRLPLNYYETRRSGEIVSRLTDIKEINQLVSQVIVSLPSQFFIALVSLIVMCLYSFSLTIVAVFMAVVMTLSTIALLPILQQKTRSLFALEAETQGVLVETFKGAMTLKTTSSAAQFWEEYQGRFGKLANLSFRTTQIGIVNDVFSGLVSNIANIFLLWFGSNLVIAQQLSIGQLLAFIAMNQYVSTLVSTLVGLMDELAKVQTATRRLSEVIDYPPETDEKHQKPEAKIKDNSDIICSNVSFHYAGRIDLLENFSVRFPGGKSIALIGESGCGKSTIAKLIAGLYPVQSGNVQIGIYNLQDLDINSLRKQVVLVPQDAHFWSRSILENFYLAAPGVTFEKIVEACQISGADEFISRLPDKYQTVLGEFGANISGGQRQRLAIARGIVNDPYVLILDESTSGLDPIAESEVLESLLSYRRGKTTIFISHRPRVISRADWIILLNRGKLELEGSVESLRAKHGNHLDFLNP
ncbi:MAG: peptidase domain-containing ABC transporter [Okeania sp. SIO3I5]|uniref:peptidase domain-containing ABC transporter n=1 Tax=Okeania sp. SIO3I5 TaxID=2607805 RepID=UPI0013BD56EB|nr:peptidase domain-containing ABC transporter [Okeania sp. SIO3I5]NEQ34844.1 peptidase domain-containing ABC transporter [Okeania sp. SIO3I5]